MRARARAMAWRAGGEYPGAGRSWLVAAAAGGGGGGGGDLKQPRAGQGRRRWLVAVVPGGAGGNDGGRRGTRKKASAAAVGWLLVGALFTSPKILQNFSDSPSHRIFRCMYGVLNIDKNKN